MRAVAADSFALARDARLRLASRRYYLGVRAFQRGVIAHRRRRGVSTAWEGVRIFGYHRVVDEPDDVLAVSPRAFARHMEMLAGAGVEPITLERAIDLLRRPVEGRYAVVTFDDAYHDNLEHALPVLERLGIPGTIFAPTSIVSGHSTYYWYDRPPRALGWDELRDLAAGGVLDVQPHTGTHPRLPALSDADAQREIGASKLELEARLGRPATVFSYPAGLYGDREVRLVREAGYRAAVSTDPGVNTGTGEAPERLRRTMMFWRDGDDDFAAKLHGVLDEPVALRTAVHRLRARARA